MQLFYTPDITPVRYTLPAEESAHAVRVLRLSAGDLLHLTDGRGSIYTARVVEPNVRGCIVEITETITQKRGRDYDLTIAIAPTKNIDRFEWFLEKATEIGIDRIIPVECERSERRVLRHDRAVKVVTEAVKQSLSAFHPTVEILTPLAGVIAQNVDGMKLIAHCGEAVVERKWIGDYIAKGVRATVLIGPEGDFSPAEVASAVAQGWKEVTLGEQRLRVETAGVATVTAFHFLTR